MLFGMQQAAPPGSIRSLVLSDHKRANFSMIDDLLNKKRGFMDQQQGKTVKLPCKPKDKCTASKYPRESHKRPDVKNDRREPNEKDGVAHSRSLR